MAGRLRFLLNGQTGRATGQAPFDWKKLWIFLAVVFGIFLFLVFVAIFAR